MKFNHIYQDVIVDEVKLKRTGNEFQVFVTFQAQSETLYVVLNGVRETDNISDLLEAKQLWLEYTESNQAEYGKFTLGISHESYTEICFDSLA
ncbi:MULTISPECIES: hypothetical protein [unclassified Pseudoalteromonas]|uniref:hypothetical protein n=1 Tax=unclassified Pseudoalteromonas TaxID=194690 RepID=UPI0014311BF4|nr:MULTISPECIES: hypothetical protein [unclassified Pseudoalteromonas]NIZ04856.1 hypothetical protein [Pseudoalteromonas sp. HF66]URQ89196.1 hypothetical protein J8Z25_10305 [Pseudoalteromonas sp. SCSIO 43101]